MNRITQAAQRAAATGGKMGSQFSAATAQLVAGTTKASTNLTALDIKLNTLRQQRSVLINTSDIARANREIQRVEERMEHLETMGRKRSGAGLLGGLGGLAVGAGLALGGGMVGDVVETTAKMQGLTNTINYASGSAKEAAANQAFLTKIIHDQKLPLVETMEGFRYMSGAMIGSKLQGEATRKIFEGVSTAATVMHLDAQTAGSVFLALGQIQSKGKVQAQELTLQLGQALPGATKIAAQAMGMTTAEFTKQMEQGKILSEQFLPRFAAQLQKQFGPGLATATNSLQGSLTEISNKIIELKTKVGTDFLPVIMASLQVASQFFDLLKGAKGFVEEHGLAFTVLGTAVLAYVGYTRTATLITAGWSAAVALYEVAAAAAAGSTGIWSGAMAILNTIMALNPIGLIVTGIAALIAGVMYAWNKFEGFRAFIYGFAFGAMELFKGLGNIIAGAFTMDAAQLSKGVTQLMSIGQKYQEGRAKGIASFKASHATPDEKIESQQYAPMGGPAGAGLGLDTSKSKSGGATGAGRGITHITINVHELARIELHAGGIAEGAEKIKHHVNQALLAVLNDANTMTAA